MAYSEYQFSRIDESIGECEKTIAVIGFSTMSNYRPYGAPLAVVEAANSLLKGIDALRDAIAQMKVEGHSAAEGVPTPEQTGTTTDAEFLLVLTNLLSELPR